MRIHIRHSSYLNMQTINEAPKKIALNATSLSRYISHFLGTSKGKDKFMALLQYSFDLYHSCSKHTNITHIKKLIAYNELRSIIVAEQFKDSISQARKIFRLLYFLDEIKGIQRVIRQNKHPLFKLLAISGHYASFMYYVSDNLMWIISVLVNSGILNPASEHRWKLKKNSFSQLRIVVNLIRLTCILVMRYLKESRIFNQGFNQQDSQKLCLSLIKLRRKRRFEVLDLILSILRFFMLTKSLKMKGYQYLDPVFVAFCGFTSASIALFKAVYEKKIFINLETQNKVNTKELSKGFPSQDQM
ncbi:hypothetical protein pb186bvf_004403 [Paramecium bursaria]